MRYVVMFQESPEMVEVRRNKEPAHVTLKER